MGWTDFIGIIRELSFESLKSEAMLAPRLLVIGDEQQTTHRWRTTLFGDEAKTYVDTHTFHAAPKDPLLYDLIVTIGPLPPEISRPWRDLFRRVDEPLRLVEIPVSSPEDPATIGAIRLRIADVADERALAVGRYVATMRSACANQIIASTARSNGEFALISNIPTVIPAIGNLVAVGADFLVLTKNQLMMIYKLAAVYQRNLDDQWSIYTEMIPVVGAGFVWRTIAREVSSLLPFIIGTVPKVAIAYAGTYAAGRAAGTYYEQSIKLSREQMRGFYEEALERLGKNPIPVPRALRGGQGRGDEQPDDQKR